jgi:hypothetical protein
MCLEGLSEPQGIIVIEPFDTLVVGCGGDGSVHAFASTPPFKQRWVAQLGEDADDLAWDPKQGGVWAA